MQGAIDLMSNEGIKHPKESNLISRSGRRRNVGVIRKSGDISLWLDAGNHVVNGEEATAWQAG